MLTFADLIFLNLSLVRMEKNEYMDLASIAVAMATGTPLTAPPKAGELSVKESARRKAVKKLLILFAVLGFLGVLALLISVVVGLIILVVAEGVFALGYLRFSRRPPKATEEQTSR